MIFGYARVSTQSQNLDRQLDALKTYGVPDDRLFVEKISGTTKECPEIQKLQQIFRDGDILVIESLSRLGRSTKDLLTIIDRFEKQGVKVVSIKEICSATKMSQSSLYNVVKGRS